MSDLRQWLDSLGLVQYADAFESNAIQSDQVATLTAPTLLIDAENEELFDRTQHAGAVYERIKDRVMRWRLSLRSRKN